MATTPMSGKESGIDRSTRMPGSRSGADTPHTDELRDNLSDVGTNLRQAASHAMPAANEQLHRMGDNATSQAQSLEASLSACIRDKPLSSMLVAGAVGMFLGMFFIRR